MNLDILLILNLEDGFQFKCEQNVGNKMELKHCNECNQMTNHIKDDKFWICCKCGKCGDDE